MLGKELALFANFRFSRQIEGYAALNNQFRLYLV